MGWFIRTASRLVALGLVATWAMAPREGGAEEWDYPLGIASDGQALYVADRGLPGIWKVEDGKASIFFRGSRQFRTPLNAVRCVAIDAQGHVLAGDSATRDVYRLQAGRDPEPLSGGMILIPMDIAVKNDALLVADLDLHRIVQVPAAGGEIEVVFEVPAPRGLFLDSQERLWVVSHGPNHLLRADESGELVPVVAGRPFDFAHTVVVDEQGTAYVTDGYADAVWKIVEGEEPAKLVSGEPLVNPVGLTLHDGNLMVVDPRAKAIFRVDFEGNIEPLEIEFSGE